MKTMKFPLFKWKGKRLLKNWRQRRKQVWMNSFSKLRRVFSSGFLLGLHLKLKPKHSISALLPRLRMFPDIYPGHIKPKEKLLKSKSILLSRTFNSVSSPILLTEWGKITKDWLNDAHVKKPIKCVHPRVNFFNPHLHKNAISFTVGSWFIDWHLFPIKDSH